MPGYITHNFFGEQEYKKLNSSFVKDAIKKNRTVFNLGLQGPDIFFYFPAYFLINKKNLGSIMHTRKTGEYMSRMVEFVMNLDDEEEKRIATAYLTGFLGHYTLDRTCHPYIYWKTDKMNEAKDYHAKHVALETDIDFIMCTKKFKKKVSEFPYKETVRMSKDQIDIIARMLSYSLNNTFKYIRFGYEMAYAAICNFKMLISQIKDKNGNKAKFVRKAENIVVGHEHFTTMFIGDNYRIKNIDPLNDRGEEWFNPWKEELRSNETFMDLMNLASARYQEVIILLQDILDNEVEESELRKEIGNHSFLTDLEIRKWSINGKTANG